MVDIEKKIEEIRQKPEHIRLRYVWGMVVGCMVIILFIWFISLRVNFANFESSTGETVKDVKNQFNIELQEAENKEVIDNKNSTEKNQNGSVEIDELLEEANRRESLEKQQKAEEGISK